MKLSARLTAVQPPKPIGDSQRHPSAQFDIQPGERIGRPLESGRRRLLRRVALLLGIGGIAWLALGDEGRWQWAMSTAASWIAAVSERQSSKPIDRTEATAPPVPRPETEQLSRQVDAQAAPKLAELNASNRSAPDGAGSREAAKPQSGHSATDIETDEPQRLPPPRISAGDPYQARALAVGLHPEISRAVLSALTEADFRNAGIAIRNALEQTLDGGEYIWPRQREPKQALFRVHFVKGAPADCRRYVVTVIREGWSTTALPMEKCGIVRKGRAGQ